MWAKKSFFSARNISCIDDVWRSLPGWLQRKNKRIHQATFHIPAAVFESVEQQALSPLLPSVYDKTGRNLIDYEIDSMPYLTYKASKYSVPQSCAYSTVKYMIAGGKIHIFDENNGTALFAFVREVHAYCIFRTESRHCTDFQPTLHGDLAHPSRR